jgi:DNA mismatch repair protein MutS2
MTPPPTDRFDLDALEFPAVRELLTEKLATGLGRREVERLVPGATASELEELRGRVGALVRRLRHGDRVPLGGGVIEIRGWVERFFDGHHQPTNIELGELLVALKACDRVRKWALPSGGGADALARSAALMPDVADLAEEFERTIDARGEVQSSASVRLAELRREVELAESGVRAAVQRFSARDDVRKVLQNPEPVWRHERPVFAVRAEQRHRVRGVVHERSQSGATVFVEPEEVIEATNRLHDARAAAHREEQVVVAHLCRGLRRCRPEIDAAIAAVAAADLDQARARLVHEEGFVQAPVLDAGDGSSATIRLRGALHPILWRDHRADLSPAPDGRETFEVPPGLVPLELTLGDPHRQLVITGPNTGGKTVALKTVGLLAAMACAGVPVPALEGTSFTCLDGVYADIGDAQGISQNLSTFSSHVRRIARCIHAAGPRTLVLLDELGAGTDPEEGGALGLAVLEELGTRRSLSVVTTHLGRLKEFAYHHPHTENGAMAFDGESLAPVYRLEVGIPGTSHALDIAGRVGMPASVVDRARGLLEDRRDQQLDEVIQQVQKVRREAEEQRRRTEDLNRQAVRTGRELAEKEQQVDRQQAWLQEEADAVVDAAIRRLREACQPALHELSNAAQPVRDRVEELRKAFDAAVAETSIHRRRRQFAHSIRKDQAVYVPKFGKLCTVKKVDRARETVTVEVGKMRIEVGFEEISWLQPLDVR